MFKNILIFLTGAVLGAGVTYAIVNDKWQKQYEMDSLELQRMKEDLALSKRAEEVSTWGDPERPVDIPDKEKEAEAINRLIEKYRGLGLAPVVDIHIRHDDESASVSEEDDDEDDELEPKPVKKKTPNKPILISEEEYSTSKMWYDKQELYFYARDGVITDEEDDMCPPDIFDLIGEDAMPELFDKQESIFVRNDNAAVDYSIIYCDRSYRESHMTE